MMNRSFMKKERKEELDKILLLQDEKNKIIFDVISKFYKLEDENTNE